MLGADSGRYLRCHRLRRSRLTGVSLLSLIEVRAAVRGGKPCFVGTRITVYDVLEYLAGGMTAVDPSGPNVGVGGEPLLLI